MRGVALMVPVLEGDGTSRIGRFGWKSQHASLESFSADAYLNEMGITSALFPEENLSNGRFVGFGTAYDKVADPEDDGADVRAFADFMRATKAPPRDDQLTRRAWPAQYLARNTFLSTLPTAVSGRLSTNSTCLGACGLPLRSFTSCIRSSAAG